MTHRAAVIGLPVAQSLSPAIHTVAFAELDLDWTYVALEVGPPELFDVITSVRNGDYDALSVTMPHKESVARFCDVLSDDARILGAVNCVWRDGDVVRGANTDGQGCCDALEIEGGVVLQGARVQVIGAGGTARAVTLALVRRGAWVWVANRTSERAEELVAALEAHPGLPRGRAATGWAGSPDVIVNATSVGMNSDESPVDAERIGSEMTVLDAVYSPLSTRLLRDASARGARCVDGLWMLIHQARHQQLLWFGRAGSAHAMRSESLRVLAARGK